MNLSIDFVLTIPNKNHQNEAIDFIQEFFDYNSYLAGTAGLHQYINNYKSWLNKLENDLNNYEISDVPRTTYFAIRESDN
jgi:predicted acetyltransferase